MQSGVSCDEILGESRLMLLWKHLQLAIALCPNLRSIAFILRNTRKRGFCDAGVVPVARARLHDDRSVRESHQRIGFN